MSKELKEEEIFVIENTRPHVVILGAGATIATIPNGDKNGNPCSVMNGFVKKLGLESIIANVELRTQSDNICKFRSPGTVHFGVTVPLISVVGFFISL